MDSTSVLIEALRALSAQDRHLIADTIGDTHRLVDDDVGEDPVARRRVYAALSAFVRTGGTERGQENAGENTPATPQES